MFWLFLSVLIISFVLFKFGVYSAIVSTFLSVIKLALILIGIVFEIFLYKKSKGLRKVLSLPKRSG